jgi:hypothetical protein
VVRRSLDDSEIDSSRMVTFTRPPASEPARCGLRCTSAKGTDSPPLRLRAIDVLRLFGDLTRTRIAARQGLPQTHVSHLLVSSLTTLRTRLDAE